ncbi:hypothetical protein JG687_00017480 [Phytophthora cactorum]|uniref:Uncharacterized protein n=1 Tax=Phytophthora cactorum TaxID=29920 RepID=A0A8T1TN70_9STRA|nr:hypothetical protein JG687_00017480 [Phytophthora cactorum]
MAPVRGPVPLCKQLPHLLSNLDSSWLYTLLSRTRSPSEKRRLRYSKTLL